MLYDKKWNQEAKVDEVGERLLKAADYIEKHGWCQHILMDSKGRVCILGALGKVCVGDMTKENNRLREFVGPCVASWNNKPGRTVEEVTALLRNAAYL